MQTQTTSSAPALTADAELVLAALAHLGGAAYVETLCTEVYSQVGVAFDAALACAVKAGAVTRRRVTIDSGSEDLVVGAGVEAARKALDILAPFGPRRYRALREELVARIAAADAARAAEQRAALEARCARREAQALRMQAAAMEIARRLGHRVVEDAGFQAFAVMFGAPERTLLAGPGTVELRVAVEVERDAEYKAVRFVARCSPKAYSLDSKMTPDELEAYGAAIVEAARLARTLIALVPAEPCCE